MTRLNYNRETRLWEILENKTDKLLTKATDYVVACRLVDKYNEILSRKQN